MDGSEAGAVRHVQQRVVVREQVVEDVRVLVGNAQIHQGLVFLGGARNCQGDRVCGEQTRG